MKRIRTRAKAPRAHRFYSIASVRSRRVIGRFEAEKLAAAPAMPESGPTRRKLTNRPTLSTRRTPQRVGAYLPIRISANQRSSAKTAELKNTVPPSARVPTICPNQRPACLWGPTKRPKPIEFLYSVFEKMQPPMRVGLAMARRARAVCRVSRRLRRTVGGGPLSCPTTFGCSGRRPERRSRGNRSDRAHRRGLRPVCRNLSRRGRA